MSLLLGATSCQNTPWLRVRGGGHVSRGSACATRNPLSAHATRPQDKNGATPLHRAVRTRCTAAVRCLLRAGSDPTLKNKSGSTPFHLAVQNTGRGGTGEAAAVSAQREIILEFLACGVSPELKNGKGERVRDCVQSAWIREVLS